MRFKITWTLTLCIFTVLLITDGLLQASSLVGLQQKPAPTPTPSKPIPKPIKLTSHVVLISISGLRSDFVNLPETRRLEIPALRAMRETGTYAVGLESIYPSQSLPAQASIVTGLLPADHGITSDYAFDEQTGLQFPMPHFLAKEIKGDTIWDAAKREGLVTAAIGYPLTTSATIDFNLPEIPTQNGGRARFENNSINVQLFRDILDEVRSQSGTEQQETKTSKTEDLTQDSFKTEVAVRLIKKYKPNFLLINFTSLDLAQRRYGIASAEAATALRMIDGLLQQIVLATQQATLSGDIIFLIVSDRGSSPVEREFRPNVLLARKGLLTTDGQGRITTWQAVAQCFGGSAAIFVKNPKDESVIREVEKIFAGLGKDSDNPLWRILTRQEAARLGGDPRAAFYLDAAPQFKVSPQANGSLIGKAEDCATSGYLPSRGEMRGVLIIAGKGIKAKQRIEYARLIDIAPTVASLLGVELKSFRGRVLSEVMMR